MRKLTLVLFGLTLLLAACDRATPTPTEESPVPTITPPHSPISPIEPTPDQPAPPQPEAAQAAIAYLADELNIDAEQIAVVESMPVEWPDASLGCPREGEMYAAVITPGYRFTLEAEGQEYEVHTDEMGIHVVSCDGAFGGPSRIEYALETLITHLIQTYPGFGLDQQPAWMGVGEPSDLVGAVTSVWEAGPWSLEISYPVIPEPSYEGVLSHAEMGTVWIGTLESDGRIVPAQTVTLSTSVGQCDESMDPDALTEWAGVEITVQDGRILIEQNVDYVCCAEFAISVGIEGSVIKVVETNAGEICRCACGYPITMDLSDLPAGDYTVEVWGVQYFDTHPLEMLGSGEVMVP